MLSYPKNWIHKEPTANPDGVNGDGGAKEQTEPSFCYGQLWYMCLRPLSCVNINSSIPDPSGQSWGRAGNMRLADHRGFETIPRVGIRMGYRGQQTRIHHSVLPFPYFGQFTLGSLSLSLK